MKALILWADAHSANLSVRVLAEGTAALARQAFGADTVVEFQDFASLTIGTQLTPRVVAHDVGRRNGPIKQGLRGYDVVLDTGAGDSFTDIYGLKRLIVIAYVQHAARRVRVPVVLTPQTLGPFDTRRGRLLAAHSLRRATQVMSRDQSSTAYATNLGRAPTLTATDVVFALPQPPAQPEPTVPAHPRPPRSTSSSTCPGCCGTAGRTSTPRAIAAACGASSMRCSPTGAR